MSTNFPFKHVKSNSPAAANKKLVNVFAANELVLVKLCTYLTFCCTDSHLHYSLYKPHVSEVCKICVMQGLDVVSENQWLLL